MKKLLPMIATVLVIAGAATSVGMARSEGPPALSGPVSRARYTWGSDFLTEGGWQTFLATTIEKKKLGPVLVTVGGGGPEGENLPEQQLFIRVLVDGQVAQPGPVPWSSSHEVNSYTFAASRQSGFHRVAAQVSRTCEERSDPPGTPPIKCLPAVFANPSMTVLAV